MSITKSFVAVDLGDDKLSTGQFIRIEFKDGGMWPKGVLDQVCEVSYSYTSCWKKGIIYISKPPCTSKVFQIAMLVVFFVFQNQMDENWLKIWDQNSIFVKGWLMQTALFPRYGFWKCNIPFIYKPYVSTFNSSIVSDWQYYKINQIALGYCIEPKWHFLL